LPWSIQGVGEIGEERGGEAWSEFGNLGERSGGRDFP